MKKNQNRAERNSSRHSAARQAKTNASKGKALPSRHIARSITLVLFNSDGSVLERIKFPRDLSACIEDAALKMKITLQQFFHNALHDFIELPEGREPA